MPAIIVVGEALVDLFGEPGKSLAEASYFTPRFGGAPANLAVSAARLGGDVGFIGKVGRDGFGQALRKHLQGFSIDTSQFTADPLAATMIACVALPTPDHPEFLLYSGANARLTTEDINVDYIRRCQVLAFGSVTLAYTSDLAVLHAARLAKQMGAHVVFDVNLRPTIWPTLSLARQRILEAISLSSVVKLNGSEAKFLFGDVGERVAAEKIIEMGAKLCCVTMGEQGAYFRTASGDGYVLGYKVDVVDATGSGDAFLAGLIVRLAESRQDIERLAAEEIEKIISFANACGAFVATKLGAMDAPLTRAAAEAIEANGLRHV